VFKTAEIDSTFYRTPNKGTVMGWLKYSPSDFIFTAKLPKTITHDKPLGLRQDVKAIARAANIITNAIVRVFIASSNLLLSGENLSLLIGISLG
jgi:uncharacterized protein YecE (DUF72 family)